MANKNTTDFKQGLMDICSTSVTHTQATKTDAANSRCARQPDGKCRGRLLQKIADIKENGVVDLFDFSALAK